MGGASVRGSEARSNMFKFVRAPAVLRTNPNPRGRRHHDRQFRFIAHLRRRVRPVRQAVARPGRRQRRSDEAGSPAAEALQALQRQLAAIMRQMRQVRESNATAEQQARQLQDLNRQAFAIQGQIQKLLEEQLRLAQRLAAR